MSRVHVAVLASAALLLAPPARAAAQQPSTPPAPAKADTAARPAPGPGKTVEAGFGKVTFDGLLQAWYVVASEGVPNTFRIRRAELKLVGEVVPRARWTVMIDPAKLLAVNTTTTTVGGTRVLAGESVNQGSRILQDAFISVELAKPARLDVGQFKLPLSMEGVTSPGVIETVERALFTSDRSRGGAYGDIRDLGVALRGTPVRALDYQVAFTNGLGESLNASDPDRAKSLAGRVVLRLPFAAAVQVGGSGAADLAGSDATRRRLGAEAALTRGPLSLRSELMTGRDGPVPRRGGYAHAGYRITPEVQVVARYDAWDPDTRSETGVADAAERDYLGGVNWYVAGNNLKVQANYIRKTFGASLPSRAYLLVNLQTMW